MKGKYLLQRIGLLTCVVSLCSCVSLKQYPLQSYSWAAPEIRQFEALDRSQSYPKNSIMFMGSSSIRLWNTLEEDMRPFPVIQRGYGGAHFRDLIYYTDRILANHSIEMLVCFVANDIKVAPEDESPKKVLRLVKYVIKQIRAKHSDIPILFVEITPTSSRWKKWTEIQELNRLIEHHCKTDDKLHFISTANHFLNPDGRPNDELFIEDRLHLNPQGYTIWSKLIKDEIKRVKGIR